MILISRRSIHGIYQQIKRFAKKARISNADKITLHSIRRSAGTEIYNATGDIKIASEFLRHANVNTTEQCYVNFDRSNVARAVNERFNRTNNNSQQQSPFSANDEYQLFLLLQNSLTKNL